MSDRLLLFCSNIKNVTGFTIYSLEVVPFKRYQNKVYKLPGATTIHKRRNINHLIASFGIFEMK